MSKDLKIALVHDDLIQHGGAERLFEVMIETFPEADVFTSMASNRWQVQSAKFKVQNLAQNLKLRTSFMQILPFKEKLYRHYFLLYPVAFESFDFTDYDIVLSSSTRFAHGIVTRPETLHICYMNTPPRMFWEPERYFEPPPARPGLAKVVLAPFLSYLRLWDYTAAQRVDYFIANSKTPQARIKKYYGRDSTIIYPFVDLERFSECQCVNVSMCQSNYFLIVSRLTSWKKIDIAVEACNQLQLPLKIIGEGPDRPRLEKLAGLPVGRQDPTVELLGRLTDEEVVSYYQSCSALIFPQKEDFGITPLEAMACGKPVVAFEGGGALETVLAGKTGEFFYPQTAEALATVLKDFDPNRYQKEDCRRQAEKFSKKRFQQELRSFVEKTYEQYSRSL